MKIEVAIVVFSKPIFLCFLLFCLLSCKGQDKPKGKIIKLDDVPSKAIEIAPRNVFDIKIYGDSILVNNKPFDIKKLESEVKVFLLNERKNPNYSTSYDDAVVNIQTHVDAQYIIYVETYESVKAAFDSIRNDYALKEFGKSYENLPEKEMKIVRSKFKLKIAEKIIES